jgi:hypothetical protein
MKQPTKHHAATKLIEPLESRQYFSVDLVDAVSFIAPKTGTLKPGQAVTAQVQVANRGTTAAKGNLGFVLGLSANADGASMVIPETTSKKINLAAGASKSFSIKLKVPVGFVPGTYFAVAEVDPINLFNDTNLLNNAAVSLNSVAVQSPYPSLLGSWEGPAKITKGFGKGVPITQADTFLTEDDTTGAFTGTGTNYYANGVVEATYSFSGTISTKGVFSDTAVAVPLDATGVGYGKGKESGGHLKINYHNALNSGVITLTFVGAG